MLFFHRHRYGWCVALLIASCAAAACRDPVHDEAPGVCPQTYGVPSSGCFEVVGQVVGAAGQPLEGIAVGAVVLDGRGGFGPATGKTDARGWFRVRGVRYNPAPADPAAPDTLTVNVSASDPPGEPAPGFPWYRDNVRTVVTVAPVGTVPVPTSVALRLPLP